MTRIFLEEGKLLIGPSADGKWETGVFFSKPFIGAMSQNLEGPSSCVSVIFGSLSHEAIEPPGGGIGLNALVYRLRTVVLVKP